MREITRSPITPTRDSCTDLQRCQACGRAWSWQSILIRHMRGFSASRRLILAGEIVDEMNDTIVRARARTSRIRRFAARDAGDGDHD